MSDLQDELPLISVVVTTYNGERYLREQLDSVFAQGYKNFEVLVSDDCSVDGTVEILREYEGRENFTWWQNEKNLGYVKNFEYVISRSAGDYIALCDQDDIWYDNKLEELYAFLVKTKALLAYSDANLIDKFGRSLGVRLTSRFPIEPIQYGDFEKFYLRNTVNGCTALLSRELFIWASPFPKLVPHDRWLAYSAALKARLHYLDKPLLEYRMHDSNTAGISYSVPISNWRSYIAKKISMYRLGYIAAKLRRPRIINQEYIHYLMAFHDREVNLGRDATIVETLKSWAESRAGRGELSKFRPFFERNEKILGVKVRRLLFMTVRQEKLRAGIKLAYKLISLPMLFVIFFSLAAYLRSVF